MKYLWTAWQPGASKHRVLIDHKGPEKTTRLNGNGMGVTFTTHCFIWKQNFSATAAHVQFCNPTLY
jgi:hypothetical protein